MRRTRFTPTKRKALVLASLAVLGIAAAALAGSRSIVLALLALLALAGGAIALRALARRRGSEVIEPSFETSILAFPPEPKFERRLSPRS